MTLLKTQDMKITGLKTSRKKNSPPLKLPFIQINIFVNSIQFNFYWANCTKIYHSSTRQLSTHLITEWDVEIFNSDVFRQTSALASVFLPPADGLRRRRFALWPAALVVNRRVSGRAADFAFFLLLL